MFYRLRAAAEVAERGKIEIYSLCGNGSEREGYAFFTMYQKGTAESGGQDEGQSASLVSVFATKQGGL
jgi:hypothetical protein